MKFKNLLLILFTITLFACSANKNLSLNSSKENWDKAENFYSKKKYAKAAPLYEQIILERNSIYTAESQLKLAECYFKLERFSDAVFEYQELIRLFPDNKNVNTAQFMIGVAYFEQSLSPHYSQYETDKAIDAFQTFIDKYPWDQRRSEAYDYIQKCHQKKIQKNYLAGYIYYKIDDYSSALLYFDEIVNLGNKDEVELNSLYYSALIHYDRKDLEKLSATLEKMREDFPNAKELSKIIKLTVKLDKKIKHQKK